MKKSYKRLFPVSVIVPMRNSETTIIAMLNSLRNQQYQIFEIIIIDNASIDSSISRVIQYIKSHKIPHINLIKHKINIGVGASCNEGARIAGADYVVMMHSDSVLSSPYELTRLTDPFRGDSTIVASASSIILPQDVWNNYGFWQKCLLARAVGKKILGLNGKFDCLHKKSFLSIGGFDTANYGHNIGVGSEDMDLALRLQKIGKVVGSDAVVVHLHTLNNKYSFMEWIENRKLLARSYGRLMRIQSHRVFPGALVFALKPLLALVAIIPMFFPWNVILLLMFAFVYMDKMYTSRAAFKDTKILLLPGITIALIFYETFWMVESFLYLTKKKV